MSFDRNNNADLQALKSEVLTDPIDRGYVPNGGDVAIMHLLNEDIGRTVTRSIDDVKVFEVAAVIVPADYDALSDYNKEWVKMFITRPADAKLRDYRVKFQQIFTGSDTLTAAVALLDVTGSRAEELFGFGTVISSNDIAAARYA